MLKKVNERDEKAKSGRPGKNTEYRRETKSFCDLSWEIDTKAMAESEKGEGVFPLITNTRKNKWVRTLFRRREAAGPHAG